MLPKLGSILQLVAGLAGAGLLFLNFFQVTQRRLADLVETSWIALDDAHRTMRRRVLDVLAGAAHVASDFLDMALGTKLLSGSSLVATLLASWAMFYLFFGTRDALRPSENSDSLGSLVRGLIFVAVAFGLRSMRTRYLTKGSQRERVVFSLVAGMAVGLFVGERGLRGIAGLAAISHLLLLAWIPNWLGIAASRRLIRGLARPGTLWRHFVSAGMVLLIAGAGVLLALVLGIAAAIAPKVAVCMGVADTCVQDLANSPAHEKGSAALIVITGLGYLLQVIPGVLWLSICVTALVTEILFQVFHRGLYLVDRERLIESMSWRNRVGWTLLGVSGVLEVGRRLLGLPK